MQKRHAQSNLKDADAVWDFCANHPESIHQFSFLFSDRGTPKGYRHMHGFSSHTYKFVNAKGEAFWTKLHYKVGEKRAPAARGRRGPQRPLCFFVPVFIPPSFCACVSSQTRAGIQNLSAAEANKLEATDPDYATRDLFDHLESGKEAVWDVYAQFIPAAANYKFNLFDVTKVVSQKDYPLVPLGKMVLNRNPQNYFAETEQAAFAPAHMVPGIEPSPDRMLQARLFSYTDTHRHRLGANYLQIPINVRITFWLQNTIWELHKHDLGPLLLVGGRLRAFFPSLAALAPAVC